METKYYIGQEYCVRNGVPGTPLISAQFINLVNIHRARPVMLYFKGGHYDFWMVKKEFEKYLASGDIELRTERTGDPTKYLGQEFVFENNVGGKAIEVKINFDELSILFESSGCNFCMAVDEFEKQLADGRILHIEDHSRLGPLNRLLDSANLGYWEEQKLEDIDSQRLTDVISTLGKEKEFPVTATKIRNILIAELYRRSSPMWGKKTRLKEKNKELNREVDRLQEDKFQLTMKIKGISTDNSRLEQENKKLRDRSVKWKEHTKDLGLKNKSLQEKIDRLSEKINGLEYQESMQKETLKRLKDDDYNLRQSYEKQIQDLNFQCSYLTGQNKCIEEENKKFNQILGVKCDYYVRENNSLGKRIRILNDNTEETNQKIRELQEKIKKLEYWDQRRGSQSYQAGLKQEIAELESKCGYYLSLIGELELTAKKLEDKVSKAESEKYFHLNRYINIADDNTRLTKENKRQENCILHYEQEIDSLKSCYNCRYRPKSILDVAECNHRSVSVNKCPGKGCHLHEWKKDVE